MLIVGVVDTGTRDRPRPLARIVLTIERIKAWRDIPTPATDEERGGSSSPTEFEERLEDRRVGRAADRDGLTLAKHLAAVADLVTRYTAVIDHALLPSDLPGCMSCARTRKKQGVELGGHFNPIDDRYKTKQLCRFCGDQLAATHTLPPLAIIDTYHRHGAQAAGREMARRTRSLSNQR